MWDQAGGLWSEEQVGWLDQGSQTLRTQVLCCPSQLFMADSPPGRGDILNGDGAGRRSDLNTKTDHLGLDHVSPVAVLV